MSNDEEPLPAERAHRDRAEGALNLAWAAAGGALVLNVLMNLGFAVQFFERVMEDFWARALVAGCVGTIAIPLSIWLFLRASAGKYDRSIGATITRLQIPVVISFTLPVWVFIEWLVGSRLGNLEVSTHAWWSSAIPAGIINGIAIGWGGFSAGTYEHHWLRKPKAYFEDEEDEPPSP